MMSGHGLITVEKLSRLMGLAQTPRFLDVRIDEDFEADSRFIPTSVRKSHRFFSEGGKMQSAEPVVVICQRGHKLSQGVAALLRGHGIDAVSLAGGFEAWKEAQLPLVPKRVLPALLDHGHTRWVTRHRPKIDRVACPWLIRRFVDRNAEFLFVPPDDVAGVAEKFDATPFDMPTGFWTHRDGGCSFDTMIEEFGLAFPPLAHLARIVRAADTGNLNDAPEAAGLLAVSLGLSRQYNDDVTQMEAGFAIYDALYRWCRDATGETHSWSQHSRGTP
jgi:rhodanese-related sulfurtransferase